MDNITDEQRKALFDALDKRESRNEWLDLEFWETLATKYFIKGRSFDDALHSAMVAYKEAVREMYSDE